LSRELHGNIGVDILRISSQLYNNPIGLLNGVFGVVVNLKLHENIETTEKRYSRRKRDWRSWNLTNMSMTKEKNSSKAPKWSPYRNEGPFKNGPMKEKSRHSCETHLRTFISIVIGVKIAFVLDNSLIKNGDQN